MKLNGQHLCFRCGLEFGVKSSQTQRNEHEEDCLRRARERDKRQQSAKNIRFLIARMQRRQARKATRK